MTMKEFITQYMKLLRMKKYEFDNDGIYSAFFKTSDRQLFESEFEDDFEEYIVMIDRCDVIDLCKKNHDKVISFDVHYFVNDQKYLLLPLLELGYVKLFMHSLDEYINKTAVLVDIYDFINTAIIKKNDTLLNILLSTDFAAIASGNERIYTGLCKRTEPMYTDYVDTKNPIRRTSRFYSIFDISKDYIFNAISNYPNNFPWCIPILLEYRKNHFEYNEGDIKL